MNIVIDNLQTINHIKNLGLDSFKITTRLNEAKYLTMIDAQLTLVNNDTNLAIDFNSPDILNRINPKAKKCSVVQAIEGRTKTKLSILDTTAGLGRDTFTLASRGHTVIAIEKDPYIYLLLLDALIRAKQIANLMNIAKNITIINTNSADYVLKTSKKFDSIYIDPMFPARRKSAKVKLDMQIMHEIAFSDEKVNSQLLENIFKINIAKKVVIKRPIKAEHLTVKKPSASLKGKTNRFDIYSL